MVVQCKFCNGKGKIFETLAGYRPCSVCGGAGEFDINISQDKAITCKFCNGNGKIFETLDGYKPCSVCKGIGIIERPFINAAPTTNTVTIHPTTPRPSHHQYDIALSFAGENRSIVENYSNLLSQKKVKVFYDKNEQADLWGKDLYEKLDEIYRKQANYCVIFISEHYAQKLWTTHERKSAQARAFVENKEYILPVKLDDTELPGMRETVGYLDLRKMSVNDLVNLTLQKLAKI
ncbi:MAG: TIR domain-containing protein [Smithella sp.]